MRLSSLPSGRGEMDGRKMRKLQKLQSTKEESVLECKLEREAQTDGEGHPFFRIREVRVWTNGKYFGS